jgi:hypothetical protein
MCFMYISWTDIGSMKCIYVNENINVKEETEYGDLERKLEC